uniref:Metalloendopeptidase n=1 Tax=Rhabdoblennius nitidus TaxID=879521 RepID=A0A455R947_9TELE|nr:hatching enzyme [Rhabdoblennius nitidus]
MRLPLELLLLLLLLGLCNTQHGNKRSFSDLVSQDLGFGEEVSEDTEDMSTTILRMSNGSSEFLFEGDLMMPKTRSARRCVRRPHRCLWPRNSHGYVEVPYILSNNYDYSEKSEISRAMKDLESETCIRFVPRHKQQGYLSIEPKFGCSSTIGYVGDRQILSLQRAGCVSFGIIQHELMHALGFHHEHNRSDRDWYITINWDNINEFYRYNFKRKETNNLGTSYDYSSVMHYGKTAFAKYRTESMTPIPNRNVPIGQRKRASPTDFLRINKLYNCRYYRG